MAREYFCRSLIQEQNWKPAVIRFLRSKLKPDRLKDISKEADGIKLDRDYALLINNKWVRVQAKTRFKLEYLFLDILIETESNKERNTLGWIYTCRADLLAYLWALEDGQVDGYLLDMPQLQDWWRSNRHRDWQMKAAPNPPPPAEPLYHTVSAVVPIDELPKSLFVYSPLW